MKKYPERIDSKFRYVLLSATRAEQIMHGAVPKIDMPGKLTEVAMAEVREDKIVWDYGPAEVTPEPAAPEADGAAEAEAES